MTSDSIWITGAHQSGKTTRLIEQFCTWADANPLQTNLLEPSTFLVFAATGDNRLDLADRLATATRGRYAFHSTTPLGFFQDEVILFFPLLAQKLNLKNQFPLRLRPETEQELATRLWQPLITDGKLVQAGVQDYYLIRRTLDLFQLAAAAGIPFEEIPVILADGFADSQIGDRTLWDCMGEALTQWRAWCLDRSLLTYGLVAELYWRYLLPDPTYQQHLKTRFRAVFADDVDEYPAIARSLFEFCLDSTIPCAFTYNPTSAIRWGLGADPNHLAGLADRCHSVSPSPHLSTTLATIWGDTLLNWLHAPNYSQPLPDIIRTLQTTSRAELLRQTAETIIAAVHTGQVQPHEIAVIGAGLDPIARYTLREILTSKGIPVRALNDQQPLTSSPLVRALLTLLGLVYPGLGRLMNREAIAEMLILLSQAPNPFQSSDSQFLPPELFPIDPVRAGLIVDHCFVPDCDRPHLLPATSFPRWDRLGYQASQAYQAILDWVMEQQQQQQQRLLPSPVVLLDRAIQRFLFGGSHLPYDQLATLRELMETAQHYWEVDTRLRQSDAAREMVGDTTRAALSETLPDRPEIPISTSVGNFIQLLRDGTITADPFPLRPLGKAAQAVTLATIYQYRSDRRYHRWQFWLDAGSPLWLTGGGGLFGAPLFLREWTGRPWTIEDTLAADEQRLQRQVLDLLSRAIDRIYLCHSDLATNGQEQTGSLLPLINAALPINS